MQRWMIKIVKRTSTLFFCLFVTIFFVEFICIILLVYVSFSLSVQALDLMVET